MKEVTVITVNPGQLTIEDYMRQLVGGSAVIADDMGDPDDQYVIEIEETKDERIG